MTSKPLVLVVDDDPAARMFASDILENGGFEILVAASADEGLAILQNRFEVQAVLTDVMMPGTLDGLAFASEIRKRWPGKQIVIASGFMPAEAAGNARDTRFLPKPFSEAQLLDALGHVQRSHV